MVDRGNFNSIKVRLEQVFSTQPIPPYQDFNSIKVRLELFLNLIDSRICILFQFHKGAIRTLRIIQYSFSAIPISIP